MSEPLPDRVAELKAKMRAGLVRYQPTLHDTKGPVYAALSELTANELGTLVQDGLYRDADVAEAALSELVRLAAERDEAPKVLADDEVCACLNDTGKREVRLYERCLRCGAFMEANYLLAERDRLIELFRRLDVMLETGNASYERVRAVIGVAALEAPRG